MLARIVHPFVHPTVPPTPFLPFLRPRKWNEKGTFGQHFFGLQPCPFNGSFNGRVNTPPAACLVAHERPPCHPAAPLSDALEPPKWGLFRGHTHMATARPTPAPRRKPHKAPLSPRFAPFPSVPTSGKRKAARRAVFSGHAQRLHAVDASSVWCVQLKAQTPPFPAVD